MFREPPEGKKKAKRRGLDEGQVRQLRNRPNSVDSGRPDPPGVNRPERTEVRRPKCLQEKEIWLAALDDFRNWLIREAA